MKIPHQSETEIPFTRLFRRKTLFRFHFHFHQKNSVSISVLQKSISVSIFSFRFHFSAEYSESFHSIFIRTHDNVIVDGRKSTRHPVYRKFICHPVDLVGEAPMNPIMVAVQTFKQMFASNSIERNLSIDPYFIILACDAKSVSSSTTIKNELVFEECSHDLDFMV
jgi:hypothetical protein